MRQRRDIQGLRALAVGLVVIFHLFPSALTGGYIGVDVFFVISGYLITGHLDRELERHGRIRFGEFWARRIRRLLPAALVVMVVSTIGALLLVPRTLLPQNLTEIAAAAGYVLNWVLAASSVDYLASDAPASVAQHYWSLSVEEQFYIVWPLLLTAAVVIGVRFLGRDRRTALIAAIGVVFVASLATSVIQTALSPAPAYFVTTTRAWEFAAGALVALLPAGGERLRTRVRLTASWVSLGAVLACGVLFTEETPFPGGIALIPVAATALLLWLGDDDHTLAPQRLSHPVAVQFVGDASYSIYLWHWPIIVLAGAAIGGPLDPLLALAAGALTVVLAWATMRWIEQPVRRAPGLLARRLPTYAGAAVAMAAVITLALTPLGVLRAEDEAAAATIAELERDPGGCFGAYALLNECDDPYALTDTVNPTLTQAGGFGLRAGDGEDCDWATIADRSEMSCELGLPAEKAAARLAFIGDSHADQYALPLALAARAHDWSVLVRTRGSCTPLAPVGVAAEDATASQAEACDRWTVDVLDQVISDTSIDTVIVAGRYELQPDSTENAHEVMKRLQDAGKSVIFIADLPGTEHEWGARDTMESAPSCVEREWRDDACAWAPVPHLDWAQTAAYEAGATIIDPSTLLCQEGRCHILVGGTIVFSDAHHISRAFARTLTGWFGDQISAALARH
ncbi:acyltransferase family protein [Microbacterium gorillae]|uniref:acyltransferase family protein n=1 Tax=Microbacterium gorillae TaxID=1231063 RepID=UPI003D996BFD